MNFKLEYLNIGTGIILFLVGILYLVELDYTSAFSWAIFGAMYLVMDDYKVPPCVEKPFNHRVREIFGVVGFVLSIALLVYVLWT